MKITLNCFSKKQERTYSNVHVTSPVPCFPIEESGRFTLMIIIELPSEFHNFSKAKNSKIKLDNRLLLGTFQSLLNF